MAVVYTGGTFDLIHPGHIDLLRHCYRLSSVPGKDRRAEVVVALNTDKFVESYKGKAPVMPYEDRATVLRALRWVDRVIANESGADSKPTILSVRPDIIAIGSDWRNRDYYAQMQFTPGWLEEQGINLMYLPLLATHSSSGLKARVAV